MPRPVTPQKVWLMRTDIPVYGFCSEECAVASGYREEIFDGAYETDGDAIEPS
jgi:hypothetical protein